MASEIAICNRALAFVGSRPILSLNEESKQGQLCKALYPAARDEVQAAHDWSFCRAQKELPQANDAPPQADWNAAYRKPQDALIVRRVFGNPDSLLETDWDIFGQYIYVRLVNQESFASVWAEYTRNELDSGLFTAGFATCVTAYLAAELAIPLTESQRTRQQLWQLYERKLAEHIGQDGAQGRTRRTTNRQLTAIRGRKGGGAFVVGPPLDFGT